MKNKKSTYVLLTVVLLIWGLVLYQFFTFSGPETEAAKTVSFKVKPLLLKPRDTFSINVNYRDPFLGKMYTPSNTGVAKKNKKQVQVAAAPVFLPNIMYKGIVSDTKNKKKVFMLIINGQTFLMAEKETELEVTLVKGNRDYIDIKYKGISNHIPIQQ